MSYTVLARKYRSWTFDEIVGQDAIATTLKNAITSGRIHHGYLFTGTRGVGKTSMARILARSLNCLSRPGPSVDPCRECESCVNIAEGQDVDVIEIDGASNTGVDNIRELRSNAIYRPARARFKIYIIDEVHMLSAGAFNALLKTLEEPPSHVKFILATTDPQKVPATIKSRCQNFDFRSIGPDDITRQIRMILEAEGCSAEDAVVRRVARLANGSMRDALSLLDQLMSISPQSLTIKLLDDVLPTPHDELLASLIDRWAEHDAGGALVALDQCISQGYSLDRFCDVMIDQLRTLMLIAVCGKDTPLVDLPTQRREEIVARAGRFDAASYVYMIAMFEDLRRNVRFSQSGRALTDALVVRLAEIVPHSSVAALLAQLEGATPADAAKKKSEPPVASPAPGWTPPTASNGASAATAPTATGDGANAPSPATASPQIPRAAPTYAPATSTPRPARPPAPGSSSYPSRTPSVRPAGRPSASPLPPAPIARPAAVTCDDMNAARSDPLVRKALEVFDGSLVNVEHVTGPGATAPPGTD